MAENRDLVFRLLHKRPDLIHKSSNLGGIYLKTASEYATGALIRHALDRAGYRDMEATEANLRECFTDYVDTGFWSNLEIEDVPDLSVKDMAEALIMSRHTIGKKGR